MDADNPPQGVKIARRITEEVANADLSPDAPQGRGPRKPSFTRAEFDKVRNMLGEEAVGIARIAKEAGLTRQTVYQIKDDRGASEAALASWGL